MTRRSASLPTRTLGLPSSTLLAAVREVMQAGGATWLVVSGWSMTPLVRPGDRVLLERQEAVRTGDIILADCDGRPVLHRVMGFTEQGVLMRGDNGTAEARAIAWDRIVGSAVLLERGSLLLALRPSLRFGVLAFIRYGLTRLWLAGLTLRRSIHRRRLLLNG